MNEQISRFLEHAADALDDANFLHQHGRIMALANRAYYAIFYYASALLLTEGITTKKHEGARVKFHELFVKRADFQEKLVKFWSGILPPANRQIMIWSLN